MSEPQRPSSKPSTPEGSPRRGITREARDAELARDGWSRRFIGSPPRLDETVQLYESLGMEVLLDPLSEEELAAECSGCTLALTLFRAVYTRRRT